MDFLDAAKAFKAKEDEVSFELPAFHYDHVNAGIKAFENAIQDGATVADAVLTEQGPNEKKSLQILGAIEKYGRTQGTLSENDLGKIISAKDAAINIRFQKLNKNLANLLTRQKKAPLKPLELQEEVLSIINEYPLQTGDDDKVRAASACGTDCQDNYIGIICLSIKSMTASKKELRDKLQQPFDSSNWKTILMDVFPNRLSLFKKPVEVAYSDEYIESFQQTGNVRLEDGKTLALFEVKVHDRVNLLKNRVRLRNTIAKPIDENGKQTVCFASLVPMTNLIVSLLSLKKPFLRMMVRLLNRRLMREDLPMFLVLGKHVTLPQSVFTTFLKILVLLG